MTVRQYTITVALEQRTYPAGPPTLVASYTLTDDFGKVIGVYHGIAAALADVVANTTGVPFDLSLRYTADAARDAARASRRIRR